MQVLVCVEQLLEPLFRFIRPDGPESLQGRRQVGENRTPSCGNKQAQQTESSAQLHVGSLASRAPKADIEVPSGTLEAS